MNRSIASDIQKRVIINTETLDWDPTIAQNITQKTLETNNNDGYEQITSLVRYSAGAIYLPHCHPNGEEIFVLEGTLYDERGDFPSGSYIRNPPGSYHQPYSKHGCLIFIKVEQMTLNETKHLHVKTYSEDWKTDILSNTDLINLYTNHDEKVDLVRYLPSESPNKISSQDDVCVELFVLYGVLNHQDEFYPKNTWIKKNGDSFQGLFSRSGCTIYRKTGHHNLLEPYSSSLTKEGINYEY